MDPQFTRRETDVMAVLWELGPATVKEVKDRLAVDLAYTTVLTMLRTLEAKGYAAHTQEGRAHRFHPLVERQEAGASALRRVVGKIFSGSPEALLTQLVSEHDLSEDELRRIRRLVDELLEEEGGGR